MKKILIYQDEGIDSFCINSILSALQQENLEQTYLICLADRHLLQKPDWQKETHLIIFPGGRDIPYHRALQGQGNRHIANFVRGGGNFLGICAGGYYGSAIIEFEQGGSLEVLAKRELKFFPGIARGPAYGLGKFHYQSGEGAQIARLNLVSASLISSAAAYYNGGCAFVDAENYDTISVIARYADIEEQPAAIVQCAVGDGQAILCGVHPECSAYHACAEKHLNNHHFFALKEIEKERRALFISLLNQLGLLTSQ